MKCSDVLAKVRHSPHWHTVRAGNITYASGECQGYSGPPPLDPPLDYVDVLRRLIILVAPTPITIGPIPTAAGWMRDTDLTPEAQHLLAEFQQRVNLAYCWSTALRLAVEAVHPR